VADIVTSLIDWAEAMRRSVRPRVPRRPSLDDASVSPPGHGGKGGRFKGHAYTPGA